ncbi:MAG: sucrase ferredoxin [Pseudomonadota bacterium]|nr:sucrase ferredoxin [Pseudomonadota bacterium]
MNSASHTTINTAVINKTFCTDLSRQLDDPLPGSGAHAERNLLISWPRAKWQRNLRHASDMPQRLKDSLDGLAASGRRVNLIHRRDQPDGLHEVMLMPERQRLRLDLDALLAFAEALASGSDLSAWPSLPQRDDVVLCCTHGKKDKCCARYGFRSYKALAHAVEQQRLPFDVWESSHLGGCRFAASIIVLSPVRKYGRIDPEHALPMLQAEAQGRRYLPGYRGASALTPVQQCAEVALLGWLDEHDATSAAGGVQLTLVEDVAGADAGTTADADSVSIHWHWRSTDHEGVVHEGRAQVLCRSMTLDRVDMCSDLAEGPSASQVWRAIKVMPARAFTKSACAR